MPNIVQCLVVLQSWVLPYAAFDFIYLTDVCWVIFLVVTYVYFVFVSYKCRLEIGFLASVCKRIT